jgi:hypothetical protein
MEAQTRYARSGGVHIAYRIFGAGPRDIVLVPGTLSHVELYWEQPSANRRRSRSEPSSRFQHRQGPGHRLRHSVR